jgi:hypothetical protein
MCECNVPHPLSFQVSKSFCFVLPKCYFHLDCRNPNPGLKTKARVYKVASQEGNQESHNIFPGMWENVRE